MFKYLSQCSCIECHEVKSVKGIHSHYIRTHTAIGREGAKQSAMKNTLPHKIQSYQKQLIKWKFYYMNPKFCNECNQPLDWFNKNNTFCNNSCCATYSNKLRPAGHLSRTQNNKSRSLKLSKPLKIKQFNSKPKYTKISFCCYCGKCFSGDRRTCSNECYINHMSKLGNDRAKHFRPVNRTKIIYKDQVLGSTYELAVCISLDANNIKWSIPNGMKYRDTAGKLHDYYADLYLPDYDVFLDPKNDYLINNPNPYHGYKDIDKIKWAEEYNNVIILVLDKNQLTWPIISNMITGRDDRNRTCTPCGART